MINITFNMLDALEAVVSWGGFQKASSRLRLTQSAVTQRILQLEDQVGSMVVTRTNPPMLTPSGEIVMRYAAHVKELRTQMLKNFEQDASTKTTFKISVNHDSLNAWLHQFIRAFGDKYRARFECDLAHEENTIQRFREGQAAVAISTVPEPISGAEAEPLGALQYILVANKRLTSKFVKAINKNAFYRSTETIFFSRDDYVCRDFYKTYTDVPFEEVPHHIMPTNTALYDFVLSGAGYALVPKPEVEGHLQKKKLFILDPKKSIKVHYYLHHWRIGSDLYKKLVQGIILEARRRLLQ